MIYSKLIIFIQLLAIVTLVCIVIVMKNDIESYRSFENNSIIIDHNQSSFKRIEEMVERYSEGKGDNLMIISPTTDSGPWIHDMYSNGREIVWIVDNTRDGMSADTGKIEYKCKEIQLNELDEYYIVELSSCNNYKDEVVLSVFTIIKDEL